MSKGMGWKKDKYDKRDYLHKLLAVVPDVCILDQWLPDVRDQGVVGSCVGHGIGANLTAWAKKLSCYSEWFSPTWIYNGARFKEGTLMYDVGAFPRDALDWLVEKGGLLEHFWPYNPKALDTKSPPSSLEPEAAKWPVLTYYRVTNGIDGICSALASGFFISIGNPWFSKWMNIGEDGVLPEVTAQDLIVGGHETFLYGYNKTTQMFYGMNSWGMGWGNKGRFLMPFSTFSIFNSLGGYDAHYVELSWAPQPPPPKPEPEKKGLTWWQWDLIGVGGVVAIVGIILLILSLTGNL